MIEDASSKTRQSLNPVGQQGFVRSFTKLFFHGLLLFGLTYILVTGWNNFIGGYFLYMISLLINFLVLVVAGGWANLKVANWIWEFRTGRLLTDYLVQGLLLAMPLFLVSGLNTYVYLWNLQYGSSISVILAITNFCIFTLLMGFVGRSVAFWFRNPPPTFEKPPSVQGSGVTTVIKEDGRRIVFRGTRSTCPKCRESDRYYEEERSREGMVECRKCGHYFYLEPIESLLEKLGENVETRYTTEL